MSKAEVTEQVTGWGYCAVPAGLWQPPRAEGEAALLQSFDHLVQDGHMADGGTYRYRRYSRLMWSEGCLSRLEGNSIYQELKDNPLNGGVKRTFAPLETAILENPFLQAILLKDADQLGLSGKWQVGVHCVRILARPALPGQPTPEGIHRDAEHFTVQHLVNRHQVRGGVFTAYNESKIPVFHWLQLVRWDTLYFSGSLWHSASPVESDLGGHRDILLIDFEPL